MAERIRPGYGLSPVSSPGQEETEGPQAGRQVRREVGLSDLQADEGGKVPQRACQLHAKAVVLQPLQGGQAELAAALPAIARG